jgi:hypothetical protein
MSFLDLRDEYVTRIGAIDGVRHCIAVDPSWDEDELKRTGAQATPTVLVQTLRAEPAPDGDYGTSLVMRFAFAATVISRSGDAVRLGSDSGGDVAAAIASRIASLLVRDARATNECGSRPMPEMANLTDAGMKRAGRNAWVVAWEADAEVDLTSELVLVDLETIHTDFDVTGATGDPDGVTDTSGEVSYV